jgi:ribosome biogenesis protein Nip4
MGSKRKSDATLVLNEFGECLGFGKILEDITGSEGRIVVKNVLDVGDFLRRESRGRF